MLEKRTVVSQIELTESGVVQVRLEKQVVEDGLVVSREYHRTLIEPGVEPADQFAVVNRHLKAMKCAEVEGHEVDRVKRIAAVEHVPAVVAAFDALRSAHQATEAKRQEAGKAAQDKPGSPEAAHAAMQVGKLESDAMTAYRNVVDTVRRGKA